MIRDEISGTIPDMPSAYLSTPAAAEILGVHADTLTRWAEEGKVPYWRTPGGQRRFRREDIEALSTPAVPKAAGE